MEVQIISRETIKPSSPTPNHLRTYKLCLFDQLAPPFYIPIILFYTAGGDHDQNPGNIMSSQHLKKSLSKALTHFYPLAGRRNIKDDLTIDCNDGGATFVVAQLACDMSFVINQDPEIDVLQQLLPCNPLHPRQDDHQSSTDQVMLYVQVNEFACGGMAIGVCISHIIADTSAAAHFLKAWAAVSSGAELADEIQGIIYDCSSFFPPQDLSPFHSVSTLIDQNNYANLPEEENEIVTRRFLFDGNKIAALKSSTKMEEFRPTRVEAVTSLIWEALIAATADNQINGNSNSPILAVAKAVDLRKRIMNPKLPHRIGNVSFSTLISSLDEEVKNRSNLAKKIHESIKEIDGECMRGSYMGSGEWIGDLIEKMRGEFEKNSKLGMFFFSSWCRIPFYETDFGWGKPKWYQSGLKIYRLGYFLDTSDGEGIEAWITLRKDEMGKLEQQPGIIAYSSFKSN